MGSDYHDHNQLPTGITTQATPTNYTTPGAITTVTSAIISTPVAASQLSTQQNLGPGILAAYPTMTSAVAPQSALTNPTPGVIGSGSLAAVAAQLTTAQYTNVPPPGLAAVNAQISTQTNPSNNTTYGSGVGGVGGGLNSITSAEQSLAVVGPIYMSPGGILNKAPSTTTTGGGP
jgi:hypothetical protein